MFWRQPLHIDLTEREKGLRCGIFEVKYLRGRVPSILVLRGVVLVVWSPLMMSPIELIEVERVVALYVDINLKSRPLEYSTTIVDHIL